MATLHFDVSDGPMRAEYTRVLRTVLKRGSLTPERRADEVIDLRAFDANALQSARRVWLSRMVSEHQSAAVFTQLVPQLMEIGASNDMKMTLLRMAMDELRHGSLCAGVVEGLGCTARVEMELKPLPMPEHHGCTPVERALRNVLFTSCLAETVAVAFTTAEREQTTDLLVRRAIEQISADESLHARFGWAFAKDVVPALSHEERARTEQWLRLAFAYLEREEMLEVPNIRPPTGELLQQHLALGVCENQQTRSLFYETVQETIVPGLCALGLDAHDAWEKRHTAHTH